MYLSDALLVAMVTDAIGVEVEPDGVVILGAGMLGVWSVNMSLTRDL